MMKWRALINSSNSWGVFLVGSRLKAATASGLSRVNGRVTADIGTVTAGTPIDGTVTISARRELGPGSVTASLVAVEETRMETHLVDGSEKDLENSGLYHTHFEELYRHDRTLAVDESVPAGETRTYVFNLPTPDVTTGATTVESGSVKIVRKLDVEESTVRRRTQTWKLHIHYDVPGLDLNEEIELPLSYEVGHAGLLDTA